LFANRSMLAQVISRKRQERELYAAHALAESVTLLELSSLACF